MRSLDKLLIETMEQEDFEEICEDAYEDQILEQVANGKLTNREFTDLLFPTEESTVSQEEEGEFI